MTNADRIRSMSMAELADLLIGYGNFTCMACMKKNHSSCDLRCSLHCLAWLKAETGDE